MKGMIGVLVKDYTRTERENAADGCTSTVRQLITFDWPCPRCGEVNSRHDYLCHHCSWLRADDPKTCPACNYVNKDTAGICKMCDSPQ